MHNKLKLRVSNWFSHGASIGGKIKAFFIKHPSIAIKAMSGTLDDFRSIQLFANQRYGFSIQFGKGKIDWGKIFKGETEFG